MMKNMMAGIRTDRTLKLSHLLIAFFLVMGTFVASFNAKAHSVAVFIEINANNQVRFHALTWHGTGEFANRPSGSMYVNGVAYRFVAVNSAPMPSNFRLVAGCSFWTSYNYTGIAYQSTDWISGINLCNPLNFNMTSYFLETPACTLSGSVNVAVPVIVSQPTFSPSATRCVGDAFNVSVTASGINLSYKWQISVNNAAFVDIGTNGTSNIGYSGLTSSTLSFSGSNNYPTSNTRYQCVVTSSGSCGTFTKASDPSPSMTVSSSPIVSSIQPTSLSGCSGSPMSLSVSASGTNLSYQWQYGAASSGTYTNTGSNAATLSFNADASVAYTNGKYLRCVVSGSCGSAQTSAAVPLSVTPLTAITSQPSNSTICENAATTFSVTAGGASLTYQWQVSRNNGTSYSPISNGAVANVGTYSGTTSNTLTISGTNASLSGALYRCVVTGTCGQATSSAATLTVNRFPAILTQPVDKTVCLPGSAAFSVSTSGTSLTYQWESNAGGVTYTNVTNGYAGGITYTGATTNQLTVTPSTSDYNGYGYRVKITGVCGSTISSTVATLSVASPATISSTSTTTPSVCEAGTISLTLTASGTNLTYKWQELISGTYTDVSGPNYRNFTTNTLTILGTPSSFSGRAYRGVATGTCGNPAYTGTITLTINQNPSISVQPTNQAICIPSAATFSVTASGYSLAYQWETSAGGVTYTNITDGGTYSGSTTNQLSITPSASINQYRYRVKLTGGCGSPLYSDPKILTVNSLPNITAEPTANAAICVSDAGTISLTNTGLGNNYQWQVSDNPRDNSSFSPLANTTTTTGISYTGVNTNSLTLGRITTSEDGYLYRCVITPDASCGSVSPTISGTVTLTVNTKPAITLQPVNANNNTYLLNNTYTSPTTTTYVYKLNATGTFTDPASSFTWKESVDGGNSWRALTTGTYSGTTNNYVVTLSGTSPYSSELKVTMLNSSTEYSNRLKYIYRCLIVGTCDNVTSNAVKVNPPPKLNRQ